MLYETLIITLLAICKNFINLSFSLVNFHITIMAANFSLEFLYTILIKRFIS